MKILLTGAHGQVGQAVINACRQRDITLAAYDRHALDITDLKKIAMVFHDVRPDIVINAAAYTAVDKAETAQDAAFAINAMGPKNLAVVCQQHDSVLIHLSTDYVFDGSKKTPYCETDPVAPLGIYGESKWQGEVAIRKNTEKYVILRTSWVFGEQGHNFVKTMLRLMREQDSLRVVADQQGCPTYAGDIAEAVLSVLSSRQWGTYHYCGTPATTWYDFAKTIYQLASQSENFKVKTIHPIITADYPTPAKRPYHSVLDCRLFCKTFGLEQKQWQKGLEKCLNG